MNWRKFARSDSLFLKLEARPNFERFCEFSFFFHLIFRFAKLLLRLPALRSIGLKCAEHHFFFKLVTEDRSMFEMDEQATAMETFIKNFLEWKTWKTRQTWQVLQSKNTSFIYGTTKCIKCYKYSYLFQDITCNLCFLGFSTRVKVNTE